VAGNPSWYGVPGSVADNVLTGKTLEPIMSHRRYTPVNTGPVLRGRICTQLQ